MPQFPCARRELWTCSSAPWVAGAGLHWHGAGSRQCRSLPSSEELLALGVGEGIAAWEPWGTDTIGRSPQGWSELSRSTQTLPAVRFLAIMVIQSQPRYGGGSDLLQALQHRTGTGLACPSVAEQVITQTVLYSDEVINDPLICAL